ncbi:muscle M-line assembly protein unc-89-like isoform X2 [Glandiceps talaboti]
MSKPCISILMGLLVICMTNATGFDTFDTFFFDSKVQKDLSEQYFFVTEPSDTRARVGSVAILHCAVGNKKGLVAWVKTTGANERVIVSLDNSIIIPDPNLMIGSRIGGRDFDLVLTNVAPRDEGFYTCFVSAGGKDSPIVSASALLTIEDY